jgi:hypothetical protein
MNSKSAKSAAKASRPHSKPQDDNETSRPGRERRPSDKITAQSKFVLILYSSFKRLFYSS